MKTLANFKAELGVSSIQFFKASTGRQYAKVKDQSIIIASNFDDKKPAVVIYNDDKKLNVICNSSAVAGVTM